MNHSLNIINHTPFSPILIKRNGAPKISTKTTVGMVQVNNSFSEQSYLPLSVAFLESYARKHVSNIDNFNFQIPIYKRISIDAALKHLEGAELVAFSVYVWNFRISCLIAEELKKIDPNITILFGGCHVPDHPKVLEEFMRSLPFVDFAICGEGEVAFASFLENYHNRNWDQVLSLAYLNEGSSFIKNPLASRVEDLNDVPSPFLTGVFDELIAANPGEGWIGLWETNRGCPFKCTYCDWGVGAKKRMADYELDRLFKEIDWFSENKVEFVYCCDANFGMYKHRDLSITEKFVENKKLYGYPEALSVQNTKNSTEASYNIQKVMTQNGLSKGVLLAFQTLNKKSLKAIKRDNIKLETYYELQRRFTAEGVETFSDMILGLPEETYETFIDGASTLIEMGQHNRIQFSNLSILPNAEMGDEEYHKKYGFKLVETQQINTHGSLGEWVDNIYETQQLVIGTNTMPPDDWVKCRSFAFMIALLHFDKLLQIPSILLNVVYGIRYKELVEAVMSVSSPVLSQAAQFFRDKARDIQSGGAEYCESTEWLSIFWPADEFFFIKLVREDMLGEFYDESLDLLTSILKSHGHVGFEQLLYESLKFNEQLIKIPFVDTNINVELNYNIWDVYRANLIGEGIELERGQYNYVIDRSSSVWNCWEQWYREVVWYGNKKGAYLYKLA